MLSTHVKKWGDISPIVPGISAYVYTTLMWCMRAECVHRWMSPGMQKLILKMFYKVWPSKCLYRTSLGQSDIRPFYCRNLFFGGHEQGGIAPLCTPLIYASAYWYLLAYLAQVAFS